MGWRLPDAEGSDGTDWDAVRVEHLVPEAGAELVANDSYILEMGFERLGGVDFRKGCYVGQEVTARMKHKTELKKGLARVLIEGDAALGAPIEAEGRPVGMLHTRSGDRALAYLRFDRAEGPMRAGDARVALDARG
jgi:folate-binding protein YgfZ